MLSTGILPTRRGLRVFRAVLQDDCGTIECAWPGQPFFERQIMPGQLLLVTGPVRYYHGRQLVPREFIILADVGEAAPERGMVLPVYPATEGLSHRQIRGLVQQHLERCWPSSSTRTRGLAAATGVPELRAALAAVHRPATLEEAEAGRRRLAFDEFFDQQLVQARARFLAKRARAGIRFELKRELTTALKEHLPFELTADQRQAIREITDDMTAPERMHRLLMGDVGTGKTVVALFAMLLAVENDYPGRDHGADRAAGRAAPGDAHAAARAARPSGPSSWWAGGPPEKAAVRDRIASGESRVVVGTHALIQESVKFQRLGLVVIDEQHRFGVEQRAALVDKGDAPDVLLLTATPIPRSLALTLYGDLDVTTLHERPPGRGTVKTALRTETARAKIYEFLRRECAAGRQAYVVYPVIEESEKIDLKAATTMAERLAKAFPELRVGLVHGRLTAEERDAVMRAFRDNEVQVLVATTVIEVGIDVANATVMLIEHAERFGLAQLHQLRGRVGRGSGAEPLHSAVGRATGRPAAHGSSPRRRRLRDRGAGPGAPGMGELAGARQSGGRGAPVRELRDRPAAARSGAARGGRDHRTRSGACAAGAHASYRDNVVQRYERGFELFRVGLMLKLRASFRTAPAPQRALRHPLAAAVSCKPWKGMFGGPPFWWRKSTMNKAADASMATWPPIRRLRARRS